MNTFCRALWGAIFSAAALLAVYSGVEHPSSIPVTATGALALIILLNSPHFLEVFFARRQAIVRPAGSTAAAVPGATAIICAYLPNEQDIVESTIRYFLTSVAYRGPFRVILACNSPEPLAIERNLRQLEKDDSRFTFLKVPHSRSKAENLNAALAMVSSPIVGFFDADAIPESDCFEKAMPWLENGYDFVQGANNVQRSHGLLGFLISIEYALKYHVSYPGRFNGFNVAYFSGSNGYWSTTVARSIGARQDAEVEDIDMAVRALISGHRLAYDHEIGCTDEAVPTPATWWKQRVRWAQGWAQLLKWHQIAIVRSSFLSPGQKAVWTLFLAGRRLAMPSAYLALLICCLFHLVHAMPVTAVELVALAAACLYLISYTLAGAVTLARDRHFTGRTFLVLAGYACVFPLYDVARELSVVRGSLALFFNPRSWTVTPRRAGSQPRSACDAQ